MFFVSVSASTHRTHVIDDSLALSTQAKAELFTTNEILFEQKVTPEIASAVRDLWKDPGILELYSRANEYQLIDSAHLYVQQCQPRPSARLSCLANLALARSLSCSFFENIDRISADDYTPTEQDLLYARARTTGITEIAFDLSGIRWRYVLLLGFLAFAFLRARGSFSTYDSHS